MTQQQTANIIQRLLAVRDKYSDNDEVRDVCEHAAAYLKKFMDDDIKSVDVYFRGWGKGKDE